MAPSPDHPERSSEFELRAARETGPEPGAGDSTSRGPDTDRYLRPAQAPDEVGRLGPFRVLRLLGEGGMGQVYLAEDPLARRRVALKVMKPHVAGVPGARERFLREIRAAAQVEHDHVVPIWQPGEDNGILYFAMPFLQGETLEARLRRERSPLALAVKVGREVAEGLAAVHDRGLIHRDVKPSNIWLEGESGVVRRAKVLDFGLARVEEGDHSTYGFVLGTPPYMSPEQAAGDHLDARSDLFGLGVVLYRMLTGELPLGGSSVSGLLSAVAGRKPAPPRVRAPEVPAPLSDLVLRLLSPNPAGRPASAHEVAAALAAIERDLPAGPSFDEASTAMEPVRPPGRRWWRRVAVGVAVGVAAGALLAALLWNKGDAEGPGSGVVGVRPPHDTPKPKPASLDRLDPTRIPAAERFDWQPRELVAVIGTHAGRHWGSALSVVVSPDGRRAATVGQDQCVRIWDVATHREMAVLTDIPGPALAFTSDSTKLAVSVKEGVRLFDLAKPKPAPLPWGPGGPLVMPAERVTHLQFSSAGPYLAVSYGGDKGVVVGIQGNKVVPRHRLTGLAPGTPLLLSESAPARAAYLLADRKTVVVLDLGGKVVAEKWKVALPEAAATLALSQGGDRLAVAPEGTGPVRLWELDGQQPRPAGVTKEKVAAKVLSFSADGKRLGACGGGLLVWNLSPAGPVQASRVPPVGLVDFDFTAEGRGAVTAADMGFVRFWDLSAATGRERVPIDLTTAPAPPQMTLAVTLLAPEPGLLGVTSYFFQGQWWDLTGTAPAPWPDAQRSVSSRRPLAASPDGRRVLVAGIDGSTALLEWQDDHFAERPSPLRGAAGCFAADGASVFAFGPPGEKGSVTRWEPEQGGDGKPVAGLQKLGQVLRLEAGRGGRLAAVVDGRVQLWRVDGPSATGLATLPELGCIDLAFTSDGETLATSTFGQGLTLHDVRGKQPRKLEGLPTREPLIASLAFSPDGGRMVTCTASGHLELWDLPARKRLREWKLPGRTCWMRFAPDGRHLLTHNANSTIYVLRLAVE